MESHRVHVWSRVKMLKFSVTNREEIVTHFHSGGKVKLCEIWTQRKCSLGWSPLASHNYPSFGLFLSLSRSSSPFFTSSSVELYENCSDPIFLWAYYQVKTNVFPFWPSVIVSSKNASTHTSAGIIFWISVGSIKKSRNS